jgi:hypothetical protein
VATSEWRPIVYREFADFPRSFFIRGKGGWLFLDAPFDDGHDDYADNLTVYDMGTARPDVFAGPSDEVPGRAVAILGRVALDGDAFDPTRRTAIRTDRLSQFLGKSRPAAPRRETGSIGAW